MSHNVTNLNLYKEDNKKDNKLSNNMDGHVLIGSHQIPKLLEGLGAVKKFSKGSVVAEVGDYPNGVFLVKSGIVGLSLLGEDGSERLLRVFKAGEFFGYRSYFGKARFHATARTMGVAEVQYIQGPELKSVIAKHPQIENFFLKSMSEDLKRAEARLFLSTEAVAKIRVVEALIYLTENYGEHPWTRKEIGDFCGTTTETVIRILSKLTKKEIIKTEKHFIKILDKEALKVEKGLNQISYSA